MSIPVNPDRKDICKITLEIPHCFIEIIEYVYKLDYDEVVNMLQHGTVRDTIKFGIIGEICSVPVFRYMLPNIVKVEAMNSFARSFLFVCQDHSVQHTMIITASECKTVYGILAWVLLQSNSDFINSILEPLDGELSPYDAIGFIAENKDEDALYALCSYAYSQNEFSVLIHRLAMANATEETALALRWNHDMIQANISAWNNQQDKFEL